MAYPKIKPEARFWSYVDKKADNECWLWLRSITHNGYGRFTISKGIEIRAHRYALYLSTGVMPADDRQVCHTCDNPLCVNPAHLFLGTATVNMQDMLSKGRANKAVGERHGHAKLREADITFIRSSLESNVALSKSLKVSPSLISMIRSGKIWKHNSRLTKKLKKAK